MGLELDGESELPTVPAEYILLGCFAAILLALLLFTSFTQSREPTQEEYKKYEERYEKELEENG